MLAEEQVQKQRNYRRRLEIEREAGQLASILVEEYKTALREKVQGQAERLRREVTRNPHHRAVALEAIDRFEHFVIRLTPPTLRWARARLDDQRM